MTICAKYAGRPVSTCTRGKDACPCAREFTMQEIANLERGITVDAERIAKLEEDLARVTAERDDAVRVMQEAAEQKPYAWDCGGDISKQESYADWFRKNQSWVAGEVIPLYAAPVPAVQTIPAGWSIKREGEALVIQHPDIGGVVVKRDPDEAREITEAILWALADSLIIKEPAP